MDEDDFRIRVAADLRAAIDGMGSVGVDETVSLLKDIIERFEAGVAYFADDGRLPEPERERWPEAHREVGVSRDPNVRAFPAFELLGIERSGRGEGMAVLTPLVHASQRLDVKFRQL
jgi:hypothetical protein